MKKVMRCLIALLLCACLLPSAAACKNNKPSIESGNSSDVETKPGNLPAETDEDAYVLDDLPDNPAFDKTVRMLYWEDVEM